MTEKISLAEAMIAVRVQIINAYITQERQARDRLVAEGFDADAIDEEIRLGRERFEAWLPTEIARLKRDVIRAFLN